MHISFDAGGSDCRRQVLVLIGSLRGVSQKMTFAVGASDPYNLLVELRKLAYNIYSFIIII